MPKKEQEHDSKKVKKAAAKKSSRRVSWDDDYESIEDEIPIARKTKKKKDGAAVRSRGSARRGAPEPSQPSRVSSRVSRAGLLGYLGFGENSPVKPIKIFGFTIKYWPLAIIAIIFMFLGYIVIDGSNLQVEDTSITIVGLPEDLEDYKIVVLSDLNGKRFGDEQTTLIRKINSLKYDMILCVGDMVGEDGDYESFFEFLDGIKYPSRVYFTCGDADPGPFVSKARDIQGTLQQIVLEDWILGAIDRGAHYVDAPVSVKVGASSLWLTPTTFLNLEASSYRNIWKEQTEQEESGTISGLASDYDSLPFTSYRYEIAKQFYNAANTITNTDTVIGLSHCVPDDRFIKSASTHIGTDEHYLPAPELIVSGHYCGGVWRLPFVLKTLYVPNDLLPRNGWFPDSEDASGLSQIGESQVYITRGLSTTSAIKLLSFRLFNPPEISMLTLTAKLPDNILEVE